MRRYFGYLSRPGSGRTLCGLAAAALLSAWLAGACGSSGGENNPDLPVVVIIPENLLVDVGQRVQLDGSESTDPEGPNSGLQFFWSALNETATVTFDDRCEDDLEQICDENSDDRCAEAQTVDCATNADCNVGNCDPGTDECEEKQTVFCNSNDDCEEGTCATNSGTTSPDCTSGICGIGDGREQSIASFVTPAPGPYEIRLLAEGEKSNNVGTRLVDTYPSLYLVGGPLFVFGGTGGAVVGEVADAASFAPNAVRGAGDPLNGNLLLADPVLGVVREFDYRTQSIVGTFGETAVLDQPVALAFNAANSLYVADADGTVDVFSGDSGLRQGTFGDVTLALEQVTSLAFVPTSGNLLVVDGRPGVGLREFDTSGAFVGIYGDTATAVGQAVDATFLAEPAPALLIADAAGDVKICSVDGTGCGSFGSVASQLAVNGPTAIAVNPAASFVPSSAVLVADKVNEYVVACAADGTGCSAFGETSGNGSQYLDIFFTPPTTPTPDTTTTSTTSTTLPDEQDEE